jgi:1-acyl-sn-glycerol-3-phosphate acyltransferase
MQGLRVCDFSFEDPAGLLSEARGVLVIANHPSLIDVIALMAVTPNADCVVKSGLFRHPLLGNALRSIGYIDNGTDVRQFLRACEGSLAAGNNIVLFPEGTRTGLDERIQFQRGAANLALRCRVDAVAVHINCQPRTLTREQPWWRAAATRPCLRLRVMQRLSFKRYPEQQATPRAARELTRDLEIYFQQVVTTNG